MLYTYYLSALRTYINPAIRPYSFVFLHYTAPLHTCTYYLITIFIPDPSGHDSDSTVSTAIADRHIS